MQDVWYEGTEIHRNYVFRFGDCDCRKRAGLYAVMKLFSELAGEEYEQRGLGYERLAERGWAFLISRVRLNCHRWPMHAEKVFVRSWERGDKGPYFYRDYELLGKDGELLIAGSSQWFLVDIASRDILRPALLEHDEAYRNPRQADCAEPLRLKKLDALPVLGKRPVYFSDLDANGHVNNAVYSRIAMDFLPEALQCREIRDYSISFFAETGAGQTLCLSGRQEGDAFLLQGDVKGAAHFGCRFGF